MITYNTQYKVNINTITPSPITLQNKQVLKDEAFFLLVGTNLYNTILVDENNEILGDNLNFEIMKQRLPFHSTELVRQSEINAIQINGLSVEQKSLISIVNYTHLVQKWIAHEEKVIFEKAKDAERQRILIQERKDKDIKDELLRQQKIAQDKIDSRVFVKRKY